MPELPKLSKIELNDNHIKGEDLINLCKYKNLIELRIANNNIKNFEEIKCLEKLSELVLIDFTLSPITKINNYREKIFENFKKLKYLDGVDKNGKAEEDDYEDDENEEDELEEDKEFIDDEKKEEDNEEEEEGEEGVELKEKNNEKEENEEEDEGEGEGEEEDEDEIKNPNPSKKRKLE